MKCKFNMIHLERYHLIEACNGYMKTDGYMKTELSEPLP